jgi:ABC-type polysaccharide/polyol phosphate transport system ATPase subunit
MWLDGGEVREIGATGEVVERYSRHLVEHAQA